LKKIQKNLLINGKKKNMKTLETYINKYILKMG